MTNALKKRAV